MISELRLLAPRCASARVIAAPTEVAARPLFKSKVMTVITRRPFMASYYRGRVMVAMEDMEGRGG